TAEPRPQGQTVGGVETVLLVELHGRQAPVAVLDDHVAGGACAVAAAVVLEPDSVVPGDVEERPWSAVIAEGKVLVVDLDRHVLRQERDLEPRHIAQPPPGESECALGTTRRSFRAPRSTESISTSASRWVSWLTRSVAARRASASSPPRTAWSAATACRMRAASPASSAPAPCPRARSVARRTVSASFRASMRSRARTSASANSNDSSTIRRTSASVSP